MELEQGIMEGAGPSMVPDKGWGLRRRKLCEDETGDQGKKCSKVQVQEPALRQRQSNFAVDELDTRERVVEERPLDDGEERSPSESGENQLQQEVPMSVAKEVGQGQRRRRFAEDGDDQERESKCSRVGLTSLPILQDLDPIQDWGKGGEEERDFEGVLGIEGDKERGEKEGRFEDH
ncbi:hypothetical protein G5714_010597 [Onychostoma macrolepis]|uniref:Uncharacterized protein n=1 Tax=Onychostoma macrolepis TaxID=369639 RepID=A0A7J6CKH7_9TELE|nr:hypothetical protein G5714_010597 [Onychostoma macrolepis]